MNRSHRHLRAGLTACVLVLAAGGMAQAQYVEDEPAMPPRAVAWRLSERGFTELTRPRFDGRAYIIEAFDPGGVRVRLFVDPQTGAILGRRRLDDARIAVMRPAPGYGWTEEDAMPRPPLRQAERLLPPADIPMAEGRGVAPRRPAFPEADYRHPDGGIREPGRTALDPNPQGVNPDRQGQAQPPRRLARVGGPPKLSDSKGADGKVSSRIVPEAPKLRPAEAAKPDAKANNPVAAAEVSKPTPPPGATPTPAAVQPPAEGTAAKVAAPGPGVVPSSESKPVEGRAADPAWKSPPENKRNVRVIGGATLVPGTPEKETPTP